MALTYFFLNTFAVAVAVAWSTNQSAWTIWKTEFASAGPNYVLGAAAILAPWVLVRSAAFNARYSAFRNMTFHFAGTYWSAVKVIYGWGLRCQELSGLDVIDFHRNPKAPELGSFGALQVRYGKRAKEVAESAKLVS